MRYVLSTISHKDLQSEVGEMIPDSLKKRLRTGEQFKVVSSYYFSRLCGVAVFSDIPGSKGYASFEEVFVREEDRGLRIGRELMENSFRLLLDRGYQTVFCRTTGTPEKVVERGRYIRSVGFYPVTANNRLVMFKASDLDEDRNGALRNLVERVNSFKDNSGRERIKIRMPEDEDKFAFIEFVKRFSYNGNDDSVKELSRVRPCLLIVDGRIVAAYMFTMVVQNLFIASDLWGDEDELRELAKLQIFGGYGIDEILFGYFVSEISQKLPKAAFQIQINSKVEDCSMLRIVSQVTKEALTIEWHLDLEKFRSIEEVEDENLLG